MRLGQLCALPLVLFSFSGSALESVVRLGLATLVCSMLCPLYAFQTDALLPLSVVFMQVIKRAHRTLRLRDSSVHSVIREGSYQWAI